MTIRDREKVRRYYDGLGESEWTRLEESSRGRVSFEVHRRFLARFVTRDDHVLEVGAGPGRYTFELAALGAHIDVTDYSAVQLGLHRHHLAGTAADRAVTSRELLDVCDTSRYGNGRFDVVVAYGGPLSYTFEQAGAALTGLLRITKPGGFVVVSVMSTLGSWRYFLRGVVQEAGAAGEGVHDLILATGDLRHLGADHICRMFRSAEVRALVDSCGADLAAISASNWASLGDPQALEVLEADSRTWARFLDHEVAACAEPGALDGGTHLLFAAQRPEDSSGATAASDQTAVRRGKPGDADEIAEVWLRSRAASVPGIPPPVHSDAEVRAWFRDVVLPAREVWVAEAEGQRIVGMLVLDGDHLDQLYIDPGWTGRLIGTSLLDLAKARRPEGFDLWTFQANEGAQRFYRRHGLQAAGTSNGDNEEGEPDVRYVWGRSWGPPDGSPAWLGSSHDDAVKRRQADARERGEPGCWSESA